MKRKFIYLVNPISGAQNKAGIIKLLTTFHNKTGLFYKILNSEASGNYLKAEQFIIEYNVTDVIVIGGDGTVSHAVQALKHLDIQFGIIPVGSGNGLAFAAGIPKNPAAALKKIYKGQADYIDAFMINGRFSCMLSGIGFDAQVAHDFAGKKSRGLITYTKQTIINFFKTTSYNFEITAGNATFFSNAFFISVANGNQFGNNVTIAPHARLNDGLLDVVIVKKMNKIKLLLAVFSQVKGNNAVEEVLDDVSGKNILYFQTPELIIKNLSSAPLHIDGEPADTSKEFSIKIIPKCFKLIQ